MNHHTPNHHSFPVTSIQYHVTCTSMFMKTKRTDKTIHLNEQHAIELFPTSRTFAFTHNMSMKGRVSIDCPEKYFKFSGKVILDRGCQAKERQNLITYKTSVIILLDFHLKMTQQKCTQYMSHMSPSSHIEKHKTLER